MNITINSLKRRTKTIVKKRNFVGKFKTGISLVKTLN